MHARPCVCDKNGRERRTYVSSARESIIYVTGRDALPQVSYTRTCLTLSSDSQRERKIVSPEKASEMERETFPSLCRVAKRERACLSAGAPIYCVQHTRWRWQSVAAVYLCARDDDSVSTSSLFFCPPSLRNCGEGGF